MRRLCHQLRERGVRLDRLRALEVFGDDGTRHTMDYAPFVASLDIWEIRPERERTLRANFPRARVTIVDSFAEVKRTANTYDLVVVDNWIGMFNGHCEHFELFPEILRVVDDQGILVLTVIGHLGEEERGPFARVHSEESLTTHLGRRRRFYRTDHPESVSVDQMLAVYRDLFAAQGVAIDWHVFQPRLDHAYLALKLRRDQGERCGDA